MLRRSVLFLLVLLLWALWSLPAASAGHWDQSQLLAAKDSTPKAQRKPQSRTQKPKDKAAESSFELLKSPGQDSPRPFRKAESVLQGR